jgi:sugar phosphate isomerase/epimerase
MATPKIGLSMLYCLSKPFKEMTKQIIGAETTYIEIVDDGLHELNKQRVSTLNDIKASNNIEYSVHAPFADINIASPSKPLLKAMLKRMKTSITLARELNAYAWVFHPGIKTGISSFYPGMDWLRNLKTTRLLVKIASEYGVKIVIENVPEPFPFLMKSVEDFTRFYAEVDEEIGLVLDIGHASLNGQIERFLTTFKDRIVHMHLSDNDGKEDQHLGVGRGTIDWEKTADLMRRISYDRVAVIESVERIEESKQKLKELFT